METVEITPQLHLIRYAFGQAYLWQDDDDLTLIDTGIPGSAPDTVAAIGAVGRDLRELRRIVLTHCHADHTGAAADLRARSGAEVLAHRLEAPVIRGAQQAGEPVLLDWERPLLEQASPLGGGPMGPPCVVDRELEDGDELGFGGGARVLSVPGHTDGSIAIHLPAHGILFTGDSIAQQDGRPIPGMFNTDRPRLLDSFRTMAALDVEIACFGHTDPFTERAGEKLRAVLPQLS